MKKEPQDVIELYILIRRACNTPFFTYESFFLRIILACSTIKYTQLLSTSLLLVSHKLNTILPPPIRL